jgi:hypothetical protein
VDLQTFEHSLEQRTPPEELEPALKALWHERRGHWTRAHDIAQDDRSSDGAWVHAYLHRREGDNANAAYWYRQAGRPIASGDLDAEWRTMAETLLARRSTS